jgi:mono/diheme cytochrome c family protein
LSLRTGIFRSVATGVSLILLIGIEAGWPQQSTLSPQATSGGSYHPGLGELMTAFVQPRHIKLGLAGREHNWPYAAYELGELGETFEDVAQLVPKHDNLAIPEMIASTVKPPMVALAAAIKGADAAAFAKGYAELTASCNACHKSAGHPEIVIQVPAVSSFPDQDFHPPQK